MEYFSYKDYVYADDRNDKDKHIAYYFDLTKYNYNEDDMNCVLSDILSSINEKSLLSCNDIFNYDIIDNDDNDGKDIFVKIKIDNNLFLYYYYDSSVD